MIKNNIKTAWRTFVKNKVYSVITIIGLTIGLLACMLVGTVVIDDSSYDRFWSRKDDLFRIISVFPEAAGGKKDQVAVANLGNELKNNFPEVEAVGSIRKGELNLRFDKSDESIGFIKTIMADSNVWNMLDISILEGNSKEFIADQNNLLISKSLKNKYFPNETAVGKTIYKVSSSGNEDQPFFIVGIMEDLPQNTYLRADVLEIIKPMSFELNREGWGMYVEQMLLMKPNTDMEVFAKKANNWYREFLTEVSEENRRNLPVFEFQSIKDIYLKSDFAFQDVKGNLANIYIFSVIAALLLLIACINFINLNTARAVRRLRETGVRKVLGASRSQLAFQFMIETLLIFVCSAILACGLYHLSLPVLESFIGHRLEFQIFSDFSIFLLFVAFILVMSIISGSYPAWVLSGFNVTNSLRNQVGSQVSSSGAGLRKLLVIFQFSMAILVLIGMVTVWRQVNFIAHKDLGFNAERVLVIPGAGGNNKESLKNELTQLQGVESVTLSGWIPTKGNGVMSKRTVSSRDPNKKLDISFISGDLDLAKTLKFNLLEGRFFERGDESSGYIDRVYVSSSGVVETSEKSETYAKVLMNRTAAQILEAFLEVPNHPLKIIPIGIIDDFHSTSLHDPVKPTVIVMEENMRYANLLVKVKAGSEAHVLKAVNDIWKRLFLVSPIGINWLDDMVQQQYVKEQKQQTLFALFSGLALFLAALGVFGLIVHATEQRVKEIGVRKVLGASVTGIVKMLSGDFVKLVFIAILIASPIAWWAMDNWLQDFAYRIDMEWWMFALAGMVAVAIALLTVSFQAVKAALANPVDSLRDE